MSTKELELTEAEARDILNSGGFARSFGALPGAHYRKDDGKGCVHLRKAPDGRWFVHRDEWEPTRYPVEHALEAVEAGIVGLLGQISDIRRSLQRDKM